MARVISQGAEATIVLDRDRIVKDRIMKRYRIKEIDERLRKSRTRREAKIIEKLNVIGVLCPKLFDADDRDMKIFMENIKGKRLRDVLERLNYVNVCKSLGEQIAQLHNNDIIHGDLTTSNMIIKDKKIYFIDFGLSFFSTKIEDRAVDLHLLRQALESKHYKIWKKCFDAVLKGYSKEHRYRDILKRLEKVEGRGRYKGKR
jgi:TP53 regulating kinase-like protein